ncbi:MAG: glycosyltransferase family 4 protein [Chloroflexi bacterium]|nr:glycosyltransferase family 4 protein [Chloroflexota bacterium]
MRIGIDARLVYYSRAGIGQYILGLLRGLATVLEEKQQEEFLVLKSRRDGSLLGEVSSFPQHPLWTPSHHLLEQWSLPLELAPLGLDLLHSPDFIPPFRRSCRSVITIHDLAFLLYPHLLTPQSARYYGQIDQAVRRTDHIIAVSEATKKDAVRLLGVPEKKITVIYEAANPIFRPASRPISREFLGQKYGLERPYLLFVSTIEPRKNLPTLLRAFRKLVDEYHPDVLLAVAGERGWLYQEVFALTKEFDLEKGVRFLGRVAEEDLPSLYQGAGGLVHPALYEGFGLPPLEAMACGTPCIVANVSSLPEVVGDAALMVDPLDINGWTVAMWQVLNDPRLKKELREKGLRRSSLFSWEKTAGETLAVYRRFAP